MRQLAPCKQSVADISIFLKCTGHMTHFLLFDFDGYCQYHSSWTRRFAASNRQLVPRAQYNMLYCINNALFSPNSGYSPRRIFRQTRTHCTHLRYLRVPHVIEDSTHPNTNVYNNIIPRLMYGGKNSERIPISRVQSYRKILTPGNHRHGDRRIRYRRVYYIHIHTRCSTHIIYI